MTKNDFSYDKKHTFSNVMKDRDEIKQLFSKSLQYTNTFYVVLWS